MVELTGRSPRPPIAAAGEVFSAFLRLGLVSFGGPTAHIGYFHTEFVERRAWLSAEAFGELVALCQTLPGPASSQLGFAIGLRRAGGLGAMAAFVGFTLPSAALMIAFAYGAQVLESPILNGVVAGLMAVAVAVVAHAVVGMARALLDGWNVWILAAGVSIVLLGGSALGWGGTLIQPALIALGAVVGWVGSGRGASGGVAGPDGAAATDMANAAEHSEQSEHPERPEHPGQSAPRAEQPVGGRALGAVSAGAGIASLVTLLVVLVAAPVFRAAPGSGVGALVDVFSRAGALVFGGGHAVLPLLEAGTVQSGWLSPGEFLAGYSLAQAVPGPMFSLAAYLGALADAGPGGVVGAIVAVLAIFAPGFLLLVGVLPFWDALRQRPSFAAAVKGAGVAVVGILAAALVHPIATGGLTSVWAALLAALGFGMLWVKAPPWLVVLMGAAVGAVAAVAGWM
ncbi:chromate transporter [Leucobacter aridicollis]|uniref:chromate transporter n=1 Tax=Leucobacter aridicollis TaxID=283878 RepID=UPI00216A78E2|nr:chromate transporter [Leucobacter aridicollis]MCS3428420.1 chromate transporter [Leucobacter aridicollis]